MANTGKATSVGNLESFPSPKGLGELLLSENRF